MVSFMNQTEPLSTRTLSDTSTWLAGTQHTAKTAKSSQRDLWSVKCPHTHLAIRVFGLLAFNTLRDPLKALSEICGVLNVHTRT
ncbi:hypothetical protein J6590_048275 [Homalodisca vitripennis]|nr:hypothetical protein J6590_048275 [Homalodisca vitripennis]